MANLTPDPNSDELSTLLMEVEEFFVENIPMAVKQEILVEPIYGIILIYSGTDTDVTGYPPILLLPTVAYRDRVHSTMRPGDWSYMLWTSCEISGQPGVHSAVCDDPKLRKKLERIFDLTIGTDECDYEPVRLMFQRVVRRLNLLDWPAILNVPDDFIVVASDSHSEISENYSDYISPDKISLLRQRGRLKME